MQRKNILGLLLCAACFLASGPNAFATTLYASRSGGGAGELFTISSANGALVQDIGPLNDVAGLNYPITGLAFNPLTGLLYGSTGNAGAVDGMLVTIAPATAQVTVVGPFNAGPVNSGGTPATMADLAFDSSGKLYGVGSIGGPNLYTINTITGQATVVGPNGASTSTAGGGVAVSAGGIVYGTPTSTRFGTYNSSTGAYTNIAAPTRPLGGAYSALAFDGGTLYGLDLGPGSGGTEATDLVTIDQVTGAVTLLGSSVQGLDAIAFTAVPEPVGIGAVAIIGLVLRRSRRDR
jgi:hypothetical protein